MNSNLNDQVPEPAPTRDEQNGGPAVTMKFDGFIPTLTIGAPDQLLNYPETGTPAAKSDCLGKSSPASNAHFGFSENGAVRESDGEVSTGISLPLKLSTYPPNTEFVIETSIKALDNGYKTSHEQFFKDMLAEIDTPSLPFGLSNVHNDGSEVTELHRMLPQDLNNRLRAQAKRIGVSLASLCHVAWAQVIARASGQERVVFGTVLFGRMQASTSKDSAMGLFINTLPLRIDINEAQVEDIVRATHSKLAALLEHEHASLALAQRCSSVPDGLPLFSSILNYRHNSTQMVTVQGFSGVRYLETQERTNYPFVLSVDDFGSTLGLTVQVIAPVACGRVFGYMQQALESLAKALEHQPTKSVRHLEILPTEERTLLLQSWNSLPVDYPDHLCLHQLFEQQVERTPDATAIVYEDQVLSYADLNTRANRLAHQLIKLGVKPDSLVAICVERSPAMIIGLLAILKAGGAYVPLDPFYASDRLRDILEDASPTVLVADAVGRKTLGEDALAPLAVVDPSTEDHETPGNPHIIGLTSQNLAYIIYTSGSTGKPKGVMLEHQGAVNLAYNRPKMFDISHNSRLLQFASLSFDTSVSEIFPALRSGAGLYLLQDDTRLDRHRLWEFLLRHSITHVYLTPTLLNDCRSMATLKSLRVLAVMGEAMPATLPQAWRTVAPNCTIINDYGPTETTVAAVAWVCPYDFSGDIVPIGRPIPNKRTYVLDAFGKPVPLGAVGELYIGGAGVARGYLNRPELTAEKFLPDPFAEGSASRMYRTGDLVRCLPDGNLVYLGRNDHQVKIRGFRIELGEIETRLTEHPLVSETVVLAMGEESQKRLVAYVIAKPDEHLKQSAEGDGSSDVAQLALALRTHLSKRLPEYMVPAAYVRLDAFPLTLNGKLDRRALPAPDSNDFARETYEEPQGEIEITLAAIWADLLRLERVSRYDSFFALGGHSLLAVQMISRLHRLGHSVSVRALFDAPTLCTLAQSIGQHCDIVTPPNLITTDDTRIVPDMLPLIDLTQDEIDILVKRVPGGVANIQDIYALSPLQDGILFHHLMAERGDPYLLFVSMVFDSRELLDRYLAAVQQVVMRHDILRTSIVWEDLSVPAQVVWREAPLAVTEVQLNPADGPVDQQLKQMFDPVHHRIDLTQAPLFRFVIAQESDGRWILVELLHHLIGDHSTLETMETEIHEFFEGRGDTLAPAHPYRNLIVQARLGTSQESHERFFKDMLAEIDTPSLPFGLSNVHNDGSEVAELHRMLPQDLNNRLRAQAKRIGVSLASLCHVAWAQVIARASGQERVVFGTVLFGRMQASTSKDSAMGLFINTLPLRIDINEAQVEDIVRATHSKLAALLEHEHASLALAQRCSGVPDGLPLFSSILNYRHNSTEMNTAQNISGVQFLEARERTNYPFILSVDDFGSTLGLTVQVTQEVGCARAWGYIQQALESLAKALAQEPSISVRQLEVIPTEERTLLLQSWNSVRVDYLDHLRLHHLFERQVKRIPDATAIVYEDQVLSYADLNTRANRLAHQLIKLGVKPDSLVAICVERSPAMIIGLLAILKAGGAYVPLDPAHGSERLLDILSDALPSVVLADAVGSSTLGQEALSSVTVVDPNWQPEGSVDNPHVSTLSMHHLAYVIYTSGSTGKPKGVMIEHRQVTRLFDATVPWYGFNEQDTWCALHSFAFDFSVWEIWGALRYGGKLLLLSQNTARSPLDLYRLVCQQGVTVLNVTPSTFRPIVESHNRDTLRDSLRYVILAGEALTPAMLEPWYATHAETSPLIVNMYGPTETTVYATYRPMTLDDCNHSFSPIGVRIPDSRAYVLNDQGLPVPIGAVGELYIGGAGVARGYLNRPELTAEKFLPDPFAEGSTSRMYRTGDLVRYLPDGNLVYLGRNDHQVKIRGFRIELGEIETRLTEHPLVSETVVLAMGEESQKRLVAYVIARSDERLKQSAEGDGSSDVAQLALALRTHLSKRLPEYMVPAAYVRLDAFPLTLNGKLDRRALPAPDSNDFARETYEEPQGEIEITLAAIWADLLRLERVSRYDSFFALGGHSLLAVQMISRLHRLGHSVSVRALFDAPTLCTLAQSIGQHCDIMTPPNLITTDDTRIVPDMLPLIDLTQDEIDILVKRVPGGVANIQDIYALSPLQDGILFHHLMAERGDPYLLFVSMVFDSRELLDRYLAAVQQVVMRHDILRTSIVWEDLSVPAQVVWREAPLAVTEVQLNPADGPVDQQLKQMFDPVHHRIDLTQAPLFRFVIAQESDGRWILVELLHHLIGDHSTLETMETEIHEFFKGRGDTLAPAHPYRNLIAQARLGTSQESHERFFKDMLAEIDTPSLPFGLSNVHNDGSEVTELHRMLPQDLNNRLRAQAKRIGVSLASLCHVAWAQVIARASGQERVVFGTVLFGRMQASTSKDSAMGLFINTLPLRIDINEAQVEDIVRATHSKLAALLEHEHASLALAQRCSGVPDGLPLFSSILNYRHNSTEMNAAQNISGVQFLESQERTNYPFTASVEDFGSTLGLTVQVTQEVACNRVFGYMQQALESLAKALEHQPTKSVRHLEILPTEERTLLLQSWNSLPVDYPDHLCLHQLFEQQVERTPDATAIVYEDQVLSYADLNTRANRLAHQLIKLGVKPDSLVAICVERSPAMIIGLLAILKAGGAYVPLDPFYASDRLRDILEDASPTVLVADAVGRKTLGEDALAPLAVVDPSTEDHETPGNPHIIGLTSQNLAYIIYTSGSTGKPKGVMLEHQGAVNLAYNRPKMFDISHDSRLLQFASLSFDTSVSEIFPALRSGAGLYLLQDDTRLDRHRLWEFLLRHSITHVYLTPTLLNDCRSMATLKSLRVLAVMGEAMPATLPQAWRSVAPNCTIINDYGPTETTVAAVAWVCPYDFSGDIVPIGRPIPNKRTYVLDAFGKPVPLGAVGELYIGGAGVARGYLNRPELTAEKFLPDPFAEGSASRMYRTGDLVRCLPDGNLVYLGRNDHQVKIRGFRIELGEIETRLTEHPLVSETVVLAMGEESQKRLVAYVIAKPDEHLKQSAEGDGSSDVAQLALALRTHLSKRLPEYMVPAAYVRLDAFPLTLNGKLDRRALPAPDSNDFARETYEEPQGEIEITLAAIWADLLRLERVSRYDSFFALGGHSLLAVQMISRLHRLGHSVSVRALFDAPTLCTLAQSIGQHCDIMTPPNPITTDDTRIVPDMLPLIDLTQDEIDILVKRVPGGVANIQDIYALSPLQDGILFHHLMAERGDPYLLFVSMVFESRELLDRYLAAVQQVVMRHDILRTSIVWEDLSVPAQVVWREAPLAVTEVQLNPADGPVDQQLKQMFDPVHHRIDLTQAPLFRFVIAQESDGRWILVELLHHLIGDHSTLEIRAVEMHAFFEGRGDTLAPAHPYRNLIAQARLGTSQESHERFFKDMLAEIDTPSLPFGLSNVHNDGSEVTELHRMLPQDLNNRLRAQAKRIGVSLASLCHVAWAQVIARASGQERVVFGTVLFGRMQASTSKDSAMGLFMNTLPVRVDVNEARVEDIVRATHSKLAALLEHEHASLALAQRCSSVPDGLPLFSSILNYRHNSTQMDTVQGFSGVRYLETQERTNYPFVLSVDDFGSTLGLTVQVIAPVACGRVFGYMQQALESLAKALEHQPTKSVRHLEILPTEERTLLLQSWNSLPVDYPDHLCLHQLFEQQVERTPDATAIVYEDQVLSYADLNTRANRLAHQLIKLGVKPDSLVAICVERSPAMIIGLLAILKAGGAYVPLDPFYASDRLRDILEDASPTVLVADAVGRKTLGEDALASQDVVDPTIEYHETIGNPHIIGLTPQDLAYIIYTSGSTGKPKGVMVEHCGVVVLAQALCETFVMEATSRVLQFASISFDNSVLEIMLALTSGARLYMPPDSVRFDRIDLWKYIDKNSITHVAITPSFLQDGNDLPVLRSPPTLALGGEALSLSLLQTLTSQGYTVINDYGPTETTISAVTWLCPSNYEGSAVPIGRPVLPARLYVLDASQEPVPLGAVGELHIGGIGVARGYLNRPELTAERFVPDPFAQTTGDRMYKTGDLVQYLPDGNMVYLGRNDHQVKIRGFRIEPGEIETRLTEHPLVAEAIVLAMGKGSEKRLAAYVIARHDDQLEQSTEGDGAGDVTQLALMLRSYLAKRLPEYMVPSAFVRLDAFPLTPNGKLDRRALPAPSSNDIARQAYEAPEGEIECALAALWMELLHVDRVSRHDGFFALGGHSLLAVKMMNIVRRMLGLGISLRTLFEAPTIAELAPRLLESGTTQEESFEVLLPIKPRGSRPPIFCVHPVLGLSWCFIALSTRLHPDQPLYGLQSRGYVGTDEPAATLDEMVKDYIAQIRRVQRQGPYHLLGYSFGGLVAHTMAATLEKQGERVGLVALMDTPADYHTRPAEPIDQEEPDLIQLLVGNRDTTINELTKSFWDKAPVISRNNSRLCSLQPPVTFNGDLLIFRAMVEQDIAAPLITHGDWKPYVLGNIELFDIQCKHQHMNRPDAAAEIARVLSQKLYEMDCLEQKED